MSGLRYWTDPENSLPVAFIDRSLDAKSISPKQLADLHSIYGTQELVLLKQVHGTKICTTAHLTLSALEGDGYYVRRNKPFRTLLGIKTADCTPVILASENYIAALHVGWRGLASGLVQVALDKFKEEVTRCLIGPHASAQTYEIGREILPQFQVLPVIHKHTEPEKCYMDMAGSIDAIVSERFPLANICSIAACTIKDANFFSVRRDGPDTGRNLTVVAC